MEEGNCGRGGLGLGKELELERKEDMEDYVREKRMDLEYSRKEL